METLEVPYYCGLLSAAQVHGAAHQAPQVFQVMVTRNRARIVCGAVRVAFIARQNAASIPVIERNTPRGTLRVSSAEATAFDLVGYPHHAGGWDQVATVLAELEELISADRLAAVAPLSPIAWAQRLGHLLELSGARERTGPLAEVVADQAREFVPLDPGSPVRSRTRRDPRWKLFVNVRVTAEA
jgi:predicted transcriptional regulator of viral defense system